MGKKIRRQFDVVANTGNDETTTDMLCGKVARLEGKVGTLMQELDQFKHANPTLNQHCMLQDLADRMDLLEKILVFVDIEKLRSSIASNSKVEDLDPCLSELTANVDQRDDASNLHDDSSTVAPDANSPAQSCTSNPEEWIQTPVRLELHKLLDLQESVDEQSMARTLHFDMAADDDEYDGFYEFTGNATEFQHDEDVFRLGVTFAVRDHTRIWKDYADWCHEFGFCKHPSDESDTDDSDVDSCGPISISSCEDTGRRKGFWFDGDSLSSGGYWVEFDDELVWHSDDDESWTYSEYEDGESLTEIDLGSCL